MTIVVKKVPKAFRGIVKFLFRIKEWFLVLRSFLFLLGPFLFAKRNDLSEKRNGPNTKNFQKLLTKPAKNDINIR